MDTYDHTYLPSKKHYTRHLNKCHKSQHQDSCQDNNWQNCSLLGWRLWLHICLILQEEGPQIYSQIHRLQDRIPNIEEQELLDKSLSSLQKVNYNISRINTSVSNTYHAFEGVRIMFFLQYINEITGIQSFIRHP